MLAALGLAEISVLPPAARGDLLDRQRDRRARRSVASRRRLRLQCRDHRRGRRGARRRAGASRRRFPTTKRRWRARSHRACNRDLVVFSGGTSKGAGDLSYRVVHGLRNPGIVAHGVALKPGKPICLAVTDGKPVVILPGFPTSAIFTFHEFVAPVIRAYAGLPAERRQTRRRHAADARELRARTNRVPAGRPGAGHSTGSPPIRWARARAR